MIFAEVLDFMGPINTIAEMIFNQVNLYAETRENELVFKKKEYRKILLIR